MDESVKSMLARLLPGIYNEEDDEDGFIIDAIASVIVHVLEDFVFPEAEE